MGEDSSESEYEQSVFPTCVFICYIFVSFILLITYTICYFCSLCCNRQPKNSSSQSDGMNRFGYKIMFCITWPIFNNCVHFIDSGIGTASYFKGQDLPSLQWIEIIVGCTIIINLTIVNFFQLKITGIAAIQRSVTKEQELRTIRQFKWVLFIYLPIFIVVSGLQYATEYLILLQI